MGISSGTINESSEEQIEDWPYSPSWFDRLTSWLEKRPGPSALYYIALAIGLLMILFGAAELGSSNDEFFTDPIKI